MTSQFRRASISPARAWALCGAACVVWVAGCDREKPADDAGAAAARAPATSPAPTPEDVSAARAVADTYARAIDRGDPAAAREVCEGDGRGVEVLAAVVTAQKKLHAAAARFGADAKVLSPDGTLEDLPARAADSKVNVRGDRASLLRAEGGAAVAWMKLKRVGGRWKVDLGAMPEMAAKAQAAPMLLATARVTAQIAGEIEAGKFATAEESWKAIDQRSAAAMRAGGISASQPAAQGVRP